MIMLAILGRILQLISVLSVDSKVNLKQLLAVLSVRSVGTMTRQLVTLLSGHVVILVILSSGQWFMDGMRKLFTGLSI